MKNKLLKIAIVSDAIYPYNKGGKETRIYELSTRLAKKGHNIHVYCMKWWNERENHKAINNVHFHAICKFYPLYSGNRRSILEAFFFALSCFKLLFENFDVLEADHMPHLVLFPLKIVALLKGKKLFVTWNEVWGRKYWNEYLGSLGNIAYVIEWLSSRMPDEIISVSQHTKNKLINELKVKQKIHVIPNGIDYSVIKKIKPSIYKSDLIFAGRLLTHKNVDVLLRTIFLLKKSFPKIKAVIIGEGPEEKNLKTMITKLMLQKNVKMIGFLNNHADLYSFMKSSKVFVIPSTREGFGIVALEANACGIPFITTDHQNNATKDLISNYTNGHAIPLEEKKLFKVIRKYLLSRCSPDKYISAAKDYDWNELTNYIEDVYKK